VVLRSGKGAWRGLLCSLGLISFPVVSAFSDVVLRSLPVDCAPLGDGLGRFHAGRSHWTMEGATAGDRLGFELLPHSADANGDGRNEVVVAAYRAGSARETYARLWALSWADSSHAPKVVWSWGGLPSVPTSDWRLRGGDLNGDHCTDLIFDVRRWTAMRVFPGSKAGWAQSPQLWQSANDEGGRTLFVCDANGDGFDDLFVGISAWNKTTGKAQLFLGSSQGLTDSPVWECKGLAPNDGFGGSFAVLDANGDGRPDLAVGERIREKKPGYVRLFLGTDGTFATQPTWTSTGPENGSSFGYQLAALGDLNRDGREELAVSAPGFRSSNGWPGMVFVFYGSPDGLEAKPRWSVLGTGRDARYGKSLSAVGDINGDGWPELAVGAPGVEEATNHAGQVEVFLGSAQGLPPKASWTAYATHATTSTGDEIAAVGDLNGDGLADFAV
jgi:hypothetical protein